MGCLRYLTVIVVIVAVGIVGLWKTFITSPIDFVPQDLKGKTILVTGGTSGIGLESARKFAEWGGRVLIPARNVEKAQAVAADIKGPGSVEIPKTKLDLMDFASVRALAEELKNEQLDIVLLNAGMNGKDEETATKDGIEQSYQVNHLSHYLLLRLLEPAIRRSKSRVVIVSSSMHYIGDLSIESQKTYTAEVKGMNDLPNTQHYCDSKLMNVILANWYHARNKAHGVVVNSVHPGFVWSNLDHNLEGSKKDFVVWFRQSTARDTVSGAVAQVTVATHPSLAKVGGRYFEDRCMPTLCAAKSCLFCEEEGYGVQPSAQAKDAQIMDWLVENSDKLVGPI